MLKLTKFRVIEISVAVVLTLAALVILGWQAWAREDAASASLASSLNEPKLAKSERR